MSQKPDQRAAPTVLDQIENLTDRGLIDYIWDSVSLDGANHRFVARLRNAVHRRIDDGEHPVPLTTQDRNRLVEIALDGSRRQA